MRLFDAVFHGDVEEVYRNIFEEADVRAPNEVGNQCVHAAAHAGNVRILDILVKAGADPNATGRAGNTPLHYACKQGHLQVVQALLDRGADPTVRNTRGNTPKDLCKLLARGFSSEDVLGSVIPVRAAADGSDQERAKIAQLLDAWVLKRCAFLTPGSPAGNAGSGKGVNAIGSAKRASDDAGGLEVLQAVKPLIAQAKQKSQAPAVGNSESARRLFPRRKGAELPRKGPRAESARAPPPIVPVPEPPPSPSPSPSPDPGPGRGGVGDQDADQEDDGPNENNHEAPEDVPGPKEPRKGFFVEIDGRQVFVPEEVEDDEDDEGDEGDEGDAGEGEVDDDDTSGATPARAGSEAGAIREAAEDAPAQASSASFKVSLRPGPVGLGMQLAESGSQTCVSALHPSGPALAAGVREGDVLILVNDSETRGLLLRDVQHLIASELALEELVELTLHRAAGQ